MRQIPTFLIALALTWTSLCPNMFGEAVGESPRQYRPLTQQRADRSLSELRKGAAFTGARLAEIGTQSHAVNVILSPEAPPAIIPIPDPDNDPLPWPIPAPKPVPRPEPRPPAPIPPPAAWPVIPCEESDACCFSEGVYSCPAAGAEIRFEQPSDLSFQLREEDVIRVVNLLKPLPPAHLASIRRITVQPYTGPTSQLAFAQGDAIVLRVAPLESRDLMTFRPGANLTLAVGNHVYNRFLSDEDRSDWAALPGQFSPDNFTSYYSLWTTDSDAVLSLAIRGEANGFITSLAAYVYMASFFSDPERGEVRFFGLGADSYGIVTLNSRSERLEVAQDQLRLGRFSFSREGSNLVAASMGDIRAELTNQLPYSQRYWSRMGER
jgi:hypothetical protein